MFSTLSTAAGCPGEVRGAGFLGVPASLTFGERLHPLPLVTLPHRA